MTIPTVAAPAAPTAPTRFTCLLCGGPLQRVNPSEHDAETAPYLCLTDRRAWWGTELTAKARAAYDPITQSWPDRAKRVAVLDGIREEQALRRARAVV